MLALCGNLKERSVASLWCDESSRAVSLCDRCVLAYAPGVPSHGAAYGDCQQLHRVNDKKVAVPAQ